MARTPLLPILLALLLLASCGNGATSSAPALPEDNFTYAVSHILILFDEQNPSAMVAKVIQTLEELRAGTPFDEVARSKSDNEKTAARGGWLGFLRPEKKDSFAGAVQALPPGQYGGPVETEKGAHFVYRHTFQEAREIERGLVIPAYGFFIPWGEHGEEPSKADAEAKAREAWDKVQKGELTLEDAALRYSTVPSPRSDLFIANAHDDGGQKGIYGIVSQAQPGELAPVGEVPGAFVVARRGVYLRSQIRHILIQHVETPNRALSVSRTKADAKALAEKVFAEIGGDTSKWAEAVRRNSDEISTVATQGWIGAITNGQLIPEMEAAILATEPGHIASEVVESREGFHIMYRMN